MLLLLTGKMNTSDPMTLKSPDVHGSLDPYLTYLGDFSVSEIKYRLEHYFKFVIVREPFERIVSAFRNKFETNTTSSQYFRKQFGRKIIDSYRENPKKRSLRYGDDLTFKEFVLYLTDSKRRVPLNEHWEKFYELCHPCLVNYDFIGKLPSIDEDSKYILSRINSGRKIKFPTRSESKYANRGADSYMSSYYSKIPRPYLRKLYEAYRPDFAIFNYTIPEVLRPMLAVKRSKRDRHLPDMNY